MTDPTDRHPTELSQEGLRDLLALLAQAGDARVSSARIDGRTVWIKRFKAKPALAKRLHAALSPLLPLAFLRSSRQIGAAGRVEREARKIAAFREAGFLVPDILFSNETVLVLSQMPPSLQDDLRRLDRDADEHDRFLVEAAAALGEVHAAGLCHGRPHPRDMFRDGGRWGFIDFEEEPEAVMPLAAAQARDLWLLFSPLADGAHSTQTPERAFMAYRGKAPAEAVAELAAIVRFFSPLAAAISATPALARHSDARRLMKATNALRDALCLRHKEPAGPRPEPAPPIGRRLK